jgi:uncharacterized membrane protein YphA (DoxX/SURF4 family)
MRRKITIEIVSSLLILLFMYAGVSKLLDYETFKVQLSKSPFITQFAGVLAWALPVGEIIVALTLAFGRTRLLGLYTSLFLMTMFAAYIYAILHYSYYIPCSCGGVLSKMDWNTHLWFNIGFIVLTIAGILRQVRELKIKKRLEMAKGVEVLPLMVFTAMS